MSLVSMTYVKALRIIVIWSALLFPGLLVVSSARAEIRIVALGDSIVLGYGTSFAGGSGGVPVSEAWPAILEGMLRSRGWNVKIVNRGLNGETSRDTLARVDSAVPSGTDLTIVIVGGKDLLRGSSPQELIGNLGKIESAINSKGSSVLINWRRWIVDLRDPTTHYTIPMYDPGDHEHFNAAGNKLIASRILPEAEKELRKRGLRPGKRQ